MSMVQRSCSLESKNKKNLVLSDEESDDYEFRSVPTHPMKVTRNSPFGYPKPKQQDEEVGSESDASDDGFGTCLADGLRMRGKPPLSMKDGLGYMNKKNPALTDEDTDDDHSESVATHPMEITINRSFGYPRLKQLDEEVTSEPDASEEGFGTTVMSNQLVVHEWDHDPSMENMIGCDNRFCAEKWFTFASICITVAPDGDWFCSKECREAVSLGSNDNVEEEPEVEGWVYFKT